MSGGALQLARLRAGGMVALAPDEHAAASRQARRLGRRLVDIDTSGRERRCLLAWPEGAMPSSADERYQLRTLTPIPLLAFACCRRLCWPDPAEPIYPGIETTEAAVLKLACSLTPADIHFKSAIRRVLPAVGLIAFDESTRRLRLGPQVACYDALELEALRRLHPRLPEANQ